MYTCNICRQMWKIMHLHFIHSWVISVPRCMTLYKIILVLCQTVISIYLFEIKTYLRILFRLLIINAHAVDAYWVWFQMSVLKHLSLWSLDRERGFFRRYITVTMWWFYDEMLLLLNLRYMALLFVDSSIKFL